MSKSETRNEIEVSQACQSETSRAAQLVSNIRILNLVLFRISKFGFRIFSMRLLDRYIVRNFLQPYIYCIIGFLSIWLIFDISDNSSTIFDERAPFGLVVHFYWTQIPQVLVILLAGFVASCRCFFPSAGCRARTKSSPC